MDLKLLSSHIWISSFFALQVCNTYPPEIVVPRAANKATVIGSSRFRSRGRIPVLSYLYKENNVSCSLSIVLGVGGDGRGSSSSERKECDDY